MWRLQTTTMPIMGAHGVIKKKTAKHVYKDTRQSQLVWNTSEEENPLKPNCGRNLIKRINTWVISLVTCSGPFLNWTREELRNIDVRTRTLMPSHKVLHPRDDVSRLDGSRKKGGKGAVIIEDAVGGAIQRAKEYINKSKKRLIIAAVARG